MFENPEVVLRCIRCLNGVELPDMTPEGRRDRKPTKKLIVKADEKTQAFLEEFESTLGRSDVSSSCPSQVTLTVQKVGRRSGRINPEISPTYHRSPHGSQRPTSRRPFGWQQRWPVSCTSRRPSSSPRSPRR